jgi:hypothetical protein
MTQQYLLLLAEGLVSLSLHWRSLLPKVGGDRGLLVGSRADSAILELERSLGSWAYAVGSIGAAEESATLLILMRGRIAGGFIAGRGTSIHGLR